MQNSFPVAVPSSIWTSKCILHRLQNSQLNQHIMIDLIFEAVFCIKVKVQISLYKSFNKLAFFEKHGILGW